MIFSGMLFDNYICLSGLDTSSDLLELHIDDWILVNLLGYIYHRLFCYFHVIIF